jgi:sulfatase maturation enzyme AslB (radical SAM superfamily)
MFVSINPSYLCNFRCPFCYLTEEQLADKKKASLDDINDRLAEVASHKSEELIFDLYGGEITSLPDDYVESLIELLRMYSSQPIRITTNLSKIPKYLLYEDIDIAVSYDGEARERSGKVYENMLRLNDRKGFDVLTLVSPEVMEMDPSEFLLRFVPLTNMRSLEFKPYSPNQANEHPITNTQYELFLSTAIEDYINLGCFTYTLQNINLLNTVLRSERSAFSDDHVYITPNGKFAVLEFDRKDNEFFLELDSFEEFIKWTELEKTRVSLNLFCSSCEYYGRCLSEHLRNVEDLDDSCSGFKHLILWYEAYVQNQADH